MIYCRRMPPDFWAAAGLLPSPKIATPTAAPKMPRFAVIARFLPAGARGIGPVLPACGTIPRRWRRVPGGRAAGPIICPFGDRLRRKGADQEPESRGPLSGAHRTMLMPLRQGRRCPRPTSLAISEYRQREVGNMLQGASPARRKLIDSAPRGIAWKRSAREFGWMPPVWQHSDELWLMT